MNNFAVFTNEPYGTDYIRPKAQAASTSRRQPKISTRDKPLDVSRSSLIRLRVWAQERDEAARQSHCMSEAYRQAVYWDGYMRAIEHILEMDGQ